MARQELDSQVLDESVRQLKSAEAGRDAARAELQSAQANVVAAEAALAKAKVDVGLAQARLRVAESDERRLAKLVDYCTLTAPYDCMVVVRNANTGDFVLPATGDGSEAQGSTEQSGMRSNPIYVVARTDVVRVFVDVDRSPAEVVTAYRTSRIAKYWSAES